MKHQRITIYFPLFYVLLLCCLGGLAQSSELYRYLDDKGVQVINDKVPPEFIGNGYDVINPDGTLIRRVARELTEEELKYRNTDESRARLREEEESRMRAWDESLMLRYSTIDDIEAARDRAIRDLQIRISILKSNLFTIKSQIESEQQKAANIERAGGEVPEELLQKISILRLEIEDTEQSVLVRNQEVDTVKASYQRDIDRFTTLLDRVKMRNQSYSTPSSRRPKY